MSFIDGIKERARKEIKTIKTIKMRNRKEVDHR